MFNDFKLLRQYLTYLFGVLLQKGSAFLLIPLYTSYLSTAEYGILEIIDGFLGMTYLFAALGVPGAINKCYQRDCESEEEKSQLIGTSLTFTLTFLSIVIAIGFLFNRTLSFYLFGTKDWSGYVNLTLVLVFLSQSALIPMQLYRTLGLAGKYVLLSGFQLGVQIIISVILLLVFNFGIKAVLIGNISGYVVIQITTIPFLQRHLRWEFSWHHLKNLSSFGLALIPISLSGWIINSSDRFFLLHMIDAHAVGIYSLSYKFGSLISLALVMPFQQAWNPFFFAMTDELQAKALLSKVFIYYFTLLCLAAGLLTVCADPLIHLLAPPDYADASGIVSFIAVSYLFGGMSLCLSTPLITKKKVRYVVAISFTGAILNLLLNLLLIQRLGMIGAAWATVCSFAIIFLFTCFAVKKWFSFSFEASRFAKVIVVVFIVSFLALQVRTKPISTIIIRSIVFMLIPIVLHLVRFFKDEEIWTIKSFYRNLFSTFKAIYSSE